MTVRRARMVATSSGFQTLSELVDLAFRTGHCEGDLGREEVGMLDNLTLEAELVSQTCDRGWTPPGSWTQRSSRHGGSASFVV